MAQKVRKRYYVLRLISTFYKFLSVIIGIGVIIAVAAVTWAYFQVPNSANLGLLGLVIAQVLVAFLSGGLSALTFWVLASLIDILINIDHKIDVLTVNVIRQLESEPMTKTDEVQAYLDRMKAKL